MLNDMHVLITGATGFVGEQLCHHLLSLGYHVTATGRKENFTIKHERLRYICIENIDGNTNWHDALQGIHTVVHLAARVHHMNDKGMAALKAYQEVNVKGTEQLAKAAIAHQVKRFIYISTVKVIAEKTIETPLRAEDRPLPTDAYSLSKLQAELILQEQAKRSGMQWVIIRPPLVYGPNVKGNFSRLISLANTMLPLPLGALKNRRSLVSVYNLCSFIECTLSHPNAVNQVFLVSDNDDLSTSQLLRLLRFTLGKRANLIPVPALLLRWLGFLLGKSKEISRVVDSLQLNIEKSMRLLSWRPPHTVQRSLEAFLSKDRPSDLINISSEAS
ncbi:MAG: NAD-dependent epimerase/dehydratase family protein [Candidatus Berkiella sp.]